MKPLSECGALLLGGTSGTGLATAKLLAGHGSRLVLLGRSPERGEAALAACREAAPGADVVFLPLDAQDPDAVLKVEEQARLHLGGVDILVCSTSISAPPQLMHTIPLAEVRRRLDELVVPPLQMIHAALPAMRAAGGGSVVAVASDAARVATPGETVIGAAMAAIIMYCKTAALEVKREGVRINLVTPSLIANTPGVDLVFAEPFSARLFEQATAQAHLGLAEPEDVAELIVFLAGPGARKITGQVVSPNGGISIA